MAVLRDFCDLFQTLKCRSAHSSPAPKKPQPRMRSGERQFFSEETRASTQCRTYSSREATLGVLHEDQTSIRDFPRYTRLPAIKIPSSNPPRIVRQRTYTVINPIIVRGPAEAFANSASVSISESGLCLQNRKKKKLLPNRRNHEDVKKELEERKRRAQERFSRSIHCRKLRMNEELNDATQHIQVRDLQRGKSAFWIEM